MFEKTSRIIFIVLFAVMLTIPLLTVNREVGKVSEAENRRLAEPAQIHNEDGTLNENFTADFETWINDNIGLRSKMVIQNARIQYHLFNVLSNNSDTILGPKGEFNYAPEWIINSYQHLDLKDEGSLFTIAYGFQCAKDYLDSKGIQFYYFQCWDKQSIYPEYFPKTIIQYGDVSRTDQNIAALTEQTNVDVISPKAALIEAKSQYDTYSKWGDATHWTQRGAYIGYRMLMEEINLNSDNRYRILDEADYDITVTDQGRTQFGGIHKEDYLENFAIREPKAYLTDEEPAWLSESAYRSRLIYQNDSVDNEDTLLIIGDSYFDNFLYDDLAESFHRTVLLWGDYCNDFVQMIDYYNPAIVIVENAERCDRTDAFAATAIDVVYGAYE